LALATPDLVALPFVDGASWRRSSLLTCLAHGVAVISTTRLSPAQPGAGITSRGMALVRSEDSAALAREIYRLLHDPARREELRANALEAAVSFDWEAVSDATQELYGRCLETARVRVGSPPERPDSRRSG